MGRRVLIVCGSPRRGGNTDTLAGAVAQGAESGGAEVVIVRLQGMDISPCLGCGGCDAEGECVVDDAMGPLYEEIAMADRVVIASPIYFYSVSAQTKIFIDRLQALWARKQLLAAAGKWQPDPRKKGYLVAVAATRGRRIFEGAALCARYAFDAMGFSWGGELPVRGMDGRSAVRESAECVDRAVEFGKKIAL